MSRQASLDQYFQCKSSPATKKSTFSLASTPIMSDKNVTKKRRSLSLVKGAKLSKAPKINNPIVTTLNTEDVVNLCSDEENESPVKDKNVNLSENLSQSQASNSSQTTIIYDIKSSTPKQSPKASPSSSSSKSFRSPNSGKFYSPTKKRAVLKRSPVKRNLTKELNFGNNSQLQRDMVEDDYFRKACEGMDDKSIFLLTIVNDCLKDGSLKELLDEKSSELLSCCFNIIKPGVRLVCRLYWRQRGWYRKDKLDEIIDHKNYKGDYELEELLNCLVENGLVKPSPDFGTNVMDFDELVKVLKGDELKQVCKDLKLKIKSKSDAVNALRCFSQRKAISSYFTQATSNNTKRVLDIMNLKAGTCYRLSDLACSALDKLYLLMYLGINYEAIRDKKLELMHINEKSYRETYPVDKAMKLDNASVVFRCKEEFEKYWNAHVIYEDYLTQNDCSEKCNIVIKVYKLYKEIVGSSKDMTRYKAVPTWLRRYTPPYLYVKILANGIQELKKVKSHHQLALDILTSLIQQTLFRQHKKADWYAEKALVLHKLLGRHDEAAEVLIEGLKSGMSEEAKDAMRPRANKIAKQQNIELAGALRAALLDAGKDVILENSFHADHVRKHHMEPTANRRGKKKFRVITQDEEKYLDAESFCVLHYTTNGDYTHGEHWEGRIVTTIYHLLFWDIIYTKPRGVPGAFLSYFQLFPLDMWDESFYTNRKAAIDERLVEIENMSEEELVDAVKAKWDERPEHELSGVNRGIGWESVCAVSACLGARAAAALCRRLAGDYGYAHSGFPDLTLWNVHTKKIKFVEVKTDTDKPSMKQLQWMRYLREHSIDTGFCYVGVESGRVRARAAPPAVTAKTVTVKSVADINNGIALG